MDSVKQLVRGCFVVNSSGCHRYDYWNEQALFDGRWDTGWCTPSRNVAQPEFIDIHIPDFGAGIVEMRILSRKINPDAGFPKRFELFNASGSTFESHFVADNIKNDIDRWHSWTFAPLKSNSIRLQIDEVAIRPEGKYFLQFMCLEFYTLGERL